MSTKREEERNEKIIRGLMKLPPNRRCINCNNLGPQYVCTNFWTFVCTTCSGIHREFTHRVKSVSMSKFTSQEVDALKRGGNQRARETYLMAWDPNKQRLPDNSNVNKVREFIKSVYVDKKYFVEKSSDRPPRDKLIMQSHEDMTRRASSYHSYSQSPPYDFRYEERTHAKRATSLSIKPGSDHILHRGTFSTLSSPGWSGNHSSDEWSEIEGSSQSSSSISEDPFKCSMLSPSPWKDTGNPFSETSSCVSRGTLQYPAVQSLSDANYGTNGERAMLQKEVDFFNTPEQFPVTLHEEASSVPTQPQLSIPTNLIDFDPFNEPTACNTQLPSPLGVELLQPLPISPVPSFTEQHSVPFSFSQSSNAEQHNGEGWASFDEDHRNAVPAQTSSSQDSIGYEVSTSVCALWNASLQNVDPATSNTQPMQKIPIGCHRDAMPSYPDAHNFLAFGVYEDGAADHTPTNPFDLPFDAEWDSDLSAQFRDTNSLQEAFPNNLVPDPFGVDTTQSWFPQQPVPHFVPGGS